MNKKLIILIVASGLLLIICFLAAGFLIPRLLAERVSGEPIQLTGSFGEPIQLISSFGEGGTIPHKYTCDGEDISPSISWSDIPNGTKSIVLIVDDPDAAEQPWAHWVLFNIPSQLTGVAEGIENIEVVRGVGIHGINNWEETGYRGPCPPVGDSHQYFFKLYALDSTLNLQPGATESEVINAMEDHILGQGQLVSSYCLSCFHF